MAKRMSKVVKKSINIDKKPVEKIVKSLPKKPKEIVVSMKEIVTPETSNDPVVLKKKLEKYKSYVRVIKTAIDKRENDVSNKYNSLQKMKDGIDKELSIIAAKKSEIVLKNQIALDNIEKATKEKRESFIAKKGVDKLIDSIQIANEKLSKDQRILKNKYITFNKEMKKLAEAKETLAAQAIGVKKLEKEVAKAKIIVEDKIAVTKQDHENNIIDAESNRTEKKRLALLAKGK